MQVYISHCEDDRPLFRRLAAALSDAGVAVWDPEREIYPGDNIWEKMGHALQESEVILAVVSRNSLATDALMSEVQFALTSSSGKYRGRLIPLLVDFPTFQAGKDVPWILLRFVPIHVTGSQNNFHEVVERVRQLLKADYNAAS